MECLPLGLTSPLDLLVSTGLNIRLSPPLSHLTPFPPLLQPHGPHLCLESTRHGPASGPLHKLFPLPGSSSPRYPHAFSLTSSWCPFTCVPPPQEAYTQPSPFTTITAPITASFSPSHSPPWDITKNINLLFVFSLVWQPHPHVSSTQMSVPPGCSLTTSFLLDSSTPDSSP